MWTLLSLERLVTPNIPAPIQGQIEGLYSHIHVCAGEVEGRGISPSPSKTTHASHSSFHGKCRVLLCGVLRPIIRIKNTKGIRRFLFPSAGYAGKRGRPPSGQGGSPSALPRVPAPPPHAPPGAQAGSEGVRRVRRRGQEVVGLLLLWGEQETEAEEEGESFVELIISNVPANAIRTCCNIWSVFYFVRGL